jgi:hypothetical protein
VKNDTSFHDVYATFLVQKTSYGPWTIANLACKAPKSLSISFRQASCAFANSASFFVLGSRNGLHKCSPRWVDVVGKIVTHCVVMVIHFLVANRSFSICKFGK